MTLSCLYEGRVAHRRLRPVKSRFAYRVFMLCLDLDELTALDPGGWIFGYNRRALLSFYDRDHGSRDGKPLTGWVVTALTKAGISAPQRIRILCFPRVLGYTFNPLSVILCYAEGDALCAVLYEVKNTFGQQHTYLFPVTGDSDDWIRQDCAKNFYVSPFMAMEGHYIFRLMPPGALFRLLIRQTIGEGDQLIASWTGERRTWSKSALMGCFWRYPLLTFKIIGAIHWQALLVFLKGARFYNRPPLPHEDVTVLYDP